MRVDYQQLRQLLEEMQPSRPAAPVPPDRLAAVLALLVERDETNLLFIRRADRGDPWSNHIAFPGGHVDPADAGPQHAAYRETAEEVSIPADAITPLGDLGTFPTQLTELWVRVFIGRWDGREPPRADPAEVAAVFEVPLGELLNHHREQGFLAKTTADLGRRLTYPVANGTIWGVTARILHHFLGLIERLDREREPDVGPQPS